MFNLLFKAIVGVVAFVTSPLWMPVFFAAAVGHVASKMIKSLSND